jgi:hypothetical protein
VIHAPVFVQSFKILTEENKLYAGYEVLIAVIVKSSVFWNIT